MKMRVLAIVLLQGILASGLAPGDTDTSAEMVVTPALPKGTTVLTLKECLRRVMSQDPAIRALRFNLEALDRRAKAVRASYLPQLIATGQIGYVAGQSTSYFSVIGVEDPEVLRRDVPGLTGYRSGGGQLTMPLVNGGSYFGVNTPPAAEVKIMEKQATEYGYELTTQQILYAVTNTYLSIVESKNKLQLLEKQRVLSQKQLQMVKGQFEYGLSTQNDVNSAEFTAQQNQMAYEAASGLSVESFLQLSLMLGIDDPQTFTIEAKYPPMPKLPSYPALMALLQDHQASVLQQEALLGAAKAQLTMDQNRIWPTVNFQGNYAYADAFSNTDASLWTAFFTVNVPIFDFGVLHNTARADLATVEADSLNVEAAKSTLLQNLYAAYSAIRDNTYAAATINAEVAAATKQEQKTEILQDMQAMTLTQSLSNQQAFIGARLEQEDLTLKDIMSYAELQTVVGGKWSWLGDNSTVYPNRALSTAP